jgi:hypothetical protein
VSFDIVAIPSETGRERSHLFGRNDAVPPAVRICIKLSEKIITFGGYERI